LRERHHEITDLGARVVAVGTGDRRYAAAFVADEQIPFLVLVDDNATAAHAASVPTLSWYRLLHPSTWKASRATKNRGYHTHKPGKRVKQVGATFVIGAGDRVRYQHIDADSTDHANVSDVIAVLREH
jgi:peroxiredoxin